MERVGEEQIVPLDGEMVGLILREQMMMTILLAKQEVLKKKRP